MPINIAELLKTKRYPGRFLAVGVDGDAYVLLYGATGRSPSSLARRFVQKDNAVFMGGVDATVAREGNPELLEYPAVKLFSNGAVVANGRQIENVSGVESREARKQLSYAMSEEAYEPDEYYTPRITGLISFASGSADAAIHIARFAPDGIDRSSWTVPLESGAGLYISTYVGADVKPTPSFSGDPLPVSFSFGDAKQAAQTVFDSLKPPKGEMDYRVGCVALYLKEGSSNISIVNKL